jgi:RNA polymerase sigma factor (TIGR02999 family)
MISCGPEATAPGLSNEEPVYGRLTKQKQYSAQLMRRILVDFARSRRYQKRGGKTRQVSLDVGLVGSGKKSADLVSIDDALSALAAVDARKSQVVELRFFGGLSVKETAEVLKISSDTVMNDWKLAKVWLARELKGGEAR